MTLQIARPNSNHYRDGTHRRFRRAFLCDGTAIVWEAAIFDCGPLFGDFGEALVRMGWPPGALFDVSHDDRPGGLVWFLEGETVRALGPERAFTETGRIFDRKRTSEDFNATMEM